MNFITKSTKTNCIVASVITGLLLITLVMLSALIDISITSKLTMSLIYTVSLMLILLLWEGALQIKVFNDYKSQNKLLCADGIVSICMGALLIICSVLFCALQASKALNGVLLETSDIRIFISLFTLVMFGWKLFIGLKGLKDGRFNAWCELAFAGSWFVISILCFITMFVSNLTVLAWLIIAFSWFIIMLSIVYMIYSYTIKSPDYLVTDVAIELYNKEKEEAKREAEIEQAKINKKLGIKPTKELTVKEKLKRLKELKEADLINEEEYNDKRDDILNNF